MKAYIFVDQQVRAIETTGEKVYISKRNSHNGKGKWHEVFADEFGNMYVKFWKEQVAEVESDGGTHIMGRCHEITHMAFGY